MKKLFLLVVFLSVWAFGYNYNGVWLNSGKTSYNDPVRLIIKGRNVKPILIRGDRRVALKAKNATNVGSGLFEAWGYGYKNLVLFIKPITSTKLRVIAKKIDTNKKRIVTKSFIFKRKSAIANPNAKKRFIGNYRSSSNFSAIKKISIREIDGNIYIRAWRNTRNGIRPLGMAKAKFYDNKMHLTWNNGNLVVSATIRGYNYNPNINRYKNVELSIKATNLTTGLTNRQIMQLQRVNVNIPPQPIYRHLKIGPVDVDLMIKSY